MSNHTVIVEYFALLIIIVGYCDSIVKNFFFPEALTRKSKTNLEYKVAFALIIKASMLQILKILPISCVNVLIF